MTFHPVTPTIGNVVPPLPVADGGTGQVTLTANELLVSGTTPTGAFQQVTTGTPGQVLLSGAPPTFGAQNYGGIFGNGSDGAVIFDGIATPVAGATLSGSTYTMTRDIQGTNVTVNNGVTLKPTNFRIFCLGTFTNNGTISAAGNAASAGTAGGNNGSALLTGGAAGGNGGTGVNGTGANGSAANFGIAGGNGGAGTSGAAGSGGAISGTSNVNAQANILNTPHPLLVGITTYFNSSRTMFWGAGGGGGGSDASSNAGGGGGGGGSIVAIFAWAAVNSATGTITVQGGAGANGTGGNAGGGGGGSGGLVAVYTLAAWTQSGTVTVTGGAKGTKAGSGADGSNGGTGVSLNVVVV